jgi:hypothetical protein
VTDSAGSGKPTAVDAAEPARYVVGIDLGTTNSAVASVDTRAVSGAGSFAVETFLIPQWVDWGQVERVSTLPSFHYALPRGVSSGLTGGLPWEPQAGSSTAAREASDDEKYVVGTLARDAGMRQPGRRVASAKSWLSHDGVDRSAPLLPWRGDADVPLHSPVEISARFLTHIRRAWDVAHPDAPLDRQDVVITLPASFDEVARELTVAAARRAGLPRVYLIEEPQAAFYAWIHRNRDRWRDLVGPGQLILVCDIGGGTTDFTLIRVEPAGDRGDEVQFHRVAVGKHLILGGDNLDLALAKWIESKWDAAGLGEHSAGDPLSPRQWDRLVQACRVAKETLLSDARPESLTISIASDSSRLIGGAHNIVVTAGECDRVLVDGFFPEVASDARPEPNASGFREFGLPYARDPAITKHLAEFLATHVRAGMAAEDDSVARPDWILFNGGVMSSARLRERLIGSVRRWFAGGSNWRPRELESAELDLAVAHGAAYFGMVRRGHGVRIAANLGRSYFLQVADATPETICLIPGNAESGHRYSPHQPLRLQLGAPVQFPLWVSSTRLADAPGDRVAIDRNELSPLPPIRTVMVRGRSQSAEEIEVRMEAELSEIGTLGLFCVESDGGKRWRLEFDIRSTLQTDRQAHRGLGESRGIVDSEVVARCDQTIREAFTRALASKTAVGSLVKQLRSAAGMDRGYWPPSLLRGIWQSLMDVSDGRKLSATHECRWLNLVGYCLRPGYGMAVDDWRVGEVWRQIHGKLAFASGGSRTESLILWRRIAGGMTAGQQTELVNPWLTVLGGRSSGAQPTELAEIWRMVGSLERITVPAKTTLAEAALAQLSVKKAEPFRDAILWAIGRLVTRQPVYGPLNAVVPIERAERIATTLLDEDQHLAARQLAVMQIAQRTGDRYRDLSQPVRERVAKWLQETSAPDRYLRVVREGGVLDTEDASAIFGEALPLGIRLLGDG